MHDAGSNVAGSLLGSREALRLMQQQPAARRPAYHIFSLGFSRWGAGLSRSACTHKATKSALTQLTRSLAEEVKEAGALLRECMHAQETPSSLTVHAHPSRVPIRFCTVLAHLCTYFDIVHWGLWRILSTRRGCRADQHRGAQPIAGHGADRPAAAGRQPCCQEVLQHPG